MDLMERYGNPQLAHQQIRTARNATSSWTQKTNEGKVNINLNSQSPTRPTPSRCRVEAPQGVEASVSGRAEFKMPPGQQRDTVINFQLPDNAQARLLPPVPAPRNSTPLGKIGYGWAQVRKHGPLADRKAPLKPTYPHDGVAYATARSTTTSTATSRRLLHARRRQPLGPRERLADLPDARSAHGRPVGIYQLNDLPDDLRKTGNLIVVGTPLDHDLIKSPCSRE
jgi:hypothetical protein